MRQCPSRIQGGLVSELPRDDLQVMVMVLSDDGASDPEVLGLNGASAVLALSHLPWGGPLGYVAARLGLLRQWPVAEGMQSQVLGRSTDLTASTKPDADRRWLTQPAGVNRAGALPLPACMQGGACGKAGQR